MDANTLLAASARGERARALLGAGLAAILAADNHGDDRTLTAVRSALVDQGGERQSEVLLVDNPRAILEDGAVAPVEPFTFRRSLAQRLRRLLEGES